MILKNNEYLHHPSRYALHDLAVLMHFERAFAALKDEFHQVRLRMEVDADGFSDFDDLLMDAWNDTIAPSISACKERLGK
jgi:hypothetical protein